MIPRKARFSKSKTEIMCLGFDGKLGDRPKVWAGFLLLALRMTERNPVWAKLVLKSYARNISTLTKKSNIWRDIVVNEESFSFSTLDSYVNALQRLFVLEDLEAWCPSIRSATVIRSGKKHEFTDPSIAVAALGLTPEYLEQDLKTFGFLFECLCIRDLKIYSQSLGGTLSYYRDRYGLEADAVLHLRDGKYALIEFKLGSREIEEGAKHLLDIKRLVGEYPESVKLVIFYCRSALNSETVGFSLQ